jgi:hypothetical protein
MEIVRSSLAALCCAFVLAPDVLVLAETQDKPASPAPAPDKAPPAQTTTGATTATDKAPAAQTATGSKAAAAPATGAAPEQAPKITNDQLDSLVAPVALFPDSLLAQVLVASTYPLELVQLQQWMAKNKTLKDKALADAVAKQPWDASIQSMAAFPDLVKRLVDDVQWTTDLGNAFLAQQGDVMDAVQRMRKKAQEKGALKTNEQQKVKEEKAGTPEKTVIVIESANPEVVYVPSYTPTVVYGPPIYPYPPIYYPPYPAGGMFLSFSIGVMWGAAVWGGSCCGCGWGGNDVDINVNNNFNRNNINNGNINTGDIGSGNRGQANPKGGAGGASAGTSDRGGGGAGAGNKAGGAGAGNKAGGAGGGGGKWQHNPQHRGGTPYSDKATANKYGGDARGDSLSQRQSKAGGSPSAGNRGTGPSAGNMSSGGRGGAGGGPSAGNMSAGGSRGGSGGGYSGGGGDKVGSRNVGSSSGRSGGFGGGSGGYSGSSARASSSRGSRSMGGGGGGGGRRR